jgi:hypothetical protein
MHFRFEDDLRSRLDEIHAGVFDHLDALDHLPKEVAIEVFRTLLAHACQSQHIGNTQAARDAISRIPEHYRLKVLPDIAASTLDLRDEWEYRRLLEIAHDMVPQLLGGFVALGSAATDEAIREAATDFCKDKD